MVLPRHQRIHLQNVRIAVGARRHHFDERIGVPFLCECDDDDCHEFVIVRLPEFDTASKNHYVMVAIAHPVAGGQRAGGDDGYELYRTNDEQRAAG
ncbi:MAG TPA: hypothetical protein VGU02_03915 [Gaiellaceae bacterium]|nr:hypothetical protein [Gaiellaceae bacterium]